MVKSRMKSILAWALALVCAAGCVRMYLINKKLEHERSVFLMEAGRAGSLTQTEPEPKLQAVGETTEFLQLRNDRTDLLRLRNEVRQLREEKLALESQVKAITREAAFQLAVQRKASEAPEREFPRLE